MDRAPTGIRDDVSSLKADGSSRTAGFDARDQYAAILGDAVVLAQLGRDAEDKDAEAALARLERLGLLYWFGVNGTVLVKGYAGKG